MSDKRQLQFVDTNILVYAYDASSTEKHRRASALVSELWEQGSGCLSIQVLQEYYVTLTKKIPRPIGSREAACIVNDYGHWHLHEPELDSVIEAIHIAERYNISFWDAMIVSSAKAMRCQMIWTEDLNANQLYEGIEAVNPFK